MKPLYEQFLCVQISKAQKTEGLIVFFALFVSVKALCKMLMKSAPGVNFINILLENFLYKRASNSFSLVTFWLCNFLAQKALVKMLAKSTPSSSLLRKDDHLSQKKRLFKKEWKRSLKRKKKRKILRRYFLKKAL